MKPRRCFAPGELHRAVSRGLFLAAMLASGFLQGQDTTAPEVAEVVPAIGATVRAVDWVSVTFDEEVTGVDAEDLLLDGHPAARLTGSGQGPYLFTFDVETGRIAKLAWAQSHGITDTAGPPNVFTGAGWAYLVAPDLPPSRLVVTEFLADNPGGLQDEDGDSPDWIEIHNDGDDWVNLETWALTDDAANLGKWIFPPLLLEPRGYLVVFASGKDRRPADGGELHTNFKLSLGGEFLGLTFPAAGGAGGRREVASGFAPAYPPQKSGHSYGPDGSGTPRYFQFPTPGEANGEGFDGFVEDTKFSVDRGVYEEPFDVEITTGTAGAAIRFTLDGTPPSESHGTPYTGPIPIDGTTTLRAAAFGGNLIPTNVDTHTYIFLDDVLVQNGAGFPSTWGPVAADYRVDPDVVNAAAYRDAIRDDLLSVPSVSIVMDTADLFGAAGIYSNPTGRGDTWERPASVEMIRSDGIEGFQSDAGIQIFGGASRTPTNTGKHSLRLVFKGIYGATKLRYPLFESSAVDEFDTFMLRAGYNYKWTHSSSTQQRRAQYARDEFARQIMQEMEQPASHGRYVHVYLNGLYWGMYNLVERPDASFAASYLGGDKDDYDVIKAAEPPQAISGTKGFWNEMMDLANSGLQSAARYEQIQQYLDVDDLIDYTILNHYIGNVDAPVCICGTNRPRNFYCARLRKPGGRYHFFAWDSEHSLAEASVDRTEIGVSDANDTPARLYGRLRQNAEFRLRFADHVHRYFFNSGILTPEASIERWLKNAARMDRAVVGESARWGDYRRSTPYTRNVEWLAEQGRLVNSYFPVRSSIVLGQLRRDGLYPPVDAPVFNQHGGAVSGDFRLVMAAPEGTIYYTTDGSDPRLAGGAISSSAAVYQSGPTETLIAAGAPCDVLVPQDGALGLDWTSDTFDPAGWTTGDTGVGLERGSGYEDLIGTDVESEMYGQSTTVYIRVPFEVTDPSALVSLTLRMKYDDGFVAYVNGVRLAASNAPEEPAWDSGAARSNPDSAAVVFQEFDLSGGIAALHGGANVLAIHGLNAGASSSDLLVLPELTAAVAGGSEVTIDGRVVEVKARVLSDQGWSALNEATFVRDLPVELRVTEIMYHPPAAAASGPYSAGDFEFLELQNTDSAPLDLAGIRIEGGIEFDFSGSAVTALGPGEYVVVVDDAAAFASMYGSSGIRVAGEYSGNLSNGGEYIALVDALGRTFLDFTYDDAWYPSTDGQGRSLQIRDASLPAEDWNVSASWRASLADGGSPGRDDSQSSEGGWQMPGDINQDGTADISDAVALLLSLFVQAPDSLPCEGEAVSDGGNLLVFDINGDGAVDVTDPVSLLAHLFRGGAPPHLGTECIRIEGCASACAP